MHEWSELGKQPFTRSRGHFTVPPNTTTSEYQSRLYLAAGTVQVRRSSRGATSPLSGHSLMCSPSAHHIQAYCLCVAIASWSACEFKLLKGAQIKLRRIVRVERHGTLEI